MPFFFNLVRKFVFGTFLSGGRLTTFLDSANANVSFQITAPYQRNRYAMCDTSLASISLLRSVRFQSQVSLSYSNFQHIILFLCLGITFTFLYTCLLLQLHPLFLFDTISNVELELLLLHEYHFLNLNLPAS